MKHARDVDDLDEFAPSKWFKTNHDELLNVVFRFKHKAPSDRQDESLCRTLVEQFAAFVATLRPAVTESSHRCALANPVIDDRIVPVGDFTVHEVETLRNACRSMESLADDIHERGDVWYHPWLPAYGCALQWTKVNAGVVKLDVICVDGWERTLHFLSTGVCVHSAVSKTFSEIACANLDCSLEQKFGKVFESKLQKAQQSRGSKRSAASQSLGHQKTPQFIAAVVRRAVAAVAGRLDSIGDEDESEGDSDTDESIVPHGGTTDVGQHTGGRPRDTCWPIVQAAIAKQICCGRGLYQKTMVMFRLHLLHASMHDVQSDFNRGVGVKDGCDAIDDLFFMLQVVVENTVKLLELGYNIAALECQCSSVRASIDRLLGSLNHRSQTRFCLPEREKLQQLQSFQGRVQVDWLEHEKFTSVEASEEERHLRALTNLKGCWYLDGTTCSLSTLIDWERSTNASKSCKCLLAMRTVESFMFARSIHLNKDNIDQLSNDDDDNDLFAANIKVLVTTYKKNVDEQHQLPQLTSVLQVEQRSREMLVMWIAFCLVHQRCVRQFPLCREYSIALAWQDLKVAVLRDQTAISALKDVCKYIRGWNKRAQGPPLFHLTTQSPTFEFGRRYALSSESMIDTYNSEVESWDRHVQSKWKEVEEKRSRAADIRAELSTATEKLQSKQRELANERSCGSSGRGESKAVIQLNCKISSLKSKIKSAKCSLKRALGAPPPLVRPLPNAKDDAMQLIFMLAMPRSLEILGSLCCTAQRTLAPTEPTDDIATYSGLSNTTWKDFYVKHRRCQALCPTTTELVATAGTFFLPASSGAPSVDSLCSIAHFKSQHVVSPILQHTKLTWKDSAGDVLNPFNATQASITDSFIERLPRSYENFQWMNVWPGGNAARGNLVYSRLNHVPDAFEKVSFIALGSLRSFPNQQFRKLQCALLSDTLPWSNSLVCTIVRQSLYQIGDMSDVDEPKLVWKTDMLQYENGLNTFCTTLRAIADKLGQTPRCYENIPLLSELAGYLCQFSSAANPVVKLFSRMARTWADNSRVEGESDRTTDRTATLHQNQCILYGYALLAYTLGPLDNAASQDVCELIVLFRTSFMCASISTASTTNMLCVESRVTEMMTRRIAQLIYFVEKSGTSAVLTSLVKLVCPRSPRQLEWTQVNEEPINENCLGSCFESSGAHYAINLFTGVVLTDGNTPGGLPPTIREHQRFQTLFGRCDFEVFYVNGVFQTKSLYCDRLYEFAIQGDDVHIQELVVETSENAGSTFRLCPLAWIESISDHLPTRLWELYSHWHWVEKNCILFRPKEAKDREVFFITTIDEHDGLQCFRVPYSDTHNANVLILQQCRAYDRFDKQNEILQSVFSVLTKFEENRFLHVMRSPEGVLKIELPRFKLGFFLNSRMQFESVEHIGYVLATQQQFDDFLPRFERYLLLELQDKFDTTRPELRMLLPSGSVKEIPNGMVDIEIPYTAQSRIDVACFDVHRRLRTFEAETIGARLLLAAVCVRAGTNIPSKRLMMTGSEAAVQILRSCHSSQSCSPEERELLVSICELSFRIPAVKILAVALLTKSKQLDFIRGKEGQTTDMSMWGIDEQTEYDDLCSGRVHYNCLRSYFQNKEERTLFGRARRVLHAPFSPEFVSHIPLPEARNYAKVVEEKLQCFVHFTTHSRADNKLPLNRRPTAGVMSGTMSDDLELSWKWYQSQAQARLKVPPGVLIDELMLLLSGVASCRSEMEKYLRNVHAMAGSNARDRLLSLANVLPTMTISDIVKCSFDDEMLYALTQKLAKTSRQEFKEVVLQYMELCVLEDKVERLIWKAKRSSELSESELVNELLNVRQWESTEYPYWLAFEVEGRLQIRHEQFVVASHLIKKSGTVCQLNMGCGKTRVILPMLFLHYTLRTNRPRVVRAHFLGTLLSETRQFMHRYLSASVAQLNIFEQPFDRGSALDARRLELVHDALQETKLFGGIQMVSPEHRMSLELKALELGDKHALTPKLNEILSKTEFIDVLDECDALLHHKYHLVYAVGTPKSLCNGVERWTIAEALLRIVADSSITSRVKSVLQTPRVSCNSPDYENRLGAYPGTRLNTVVECTEHHRDELKRALVLDLIDNAPFELMFMKALGNGTAVDALMTAITDPTISLQIALADHVQRFSSYMCHLLTMRGLLAFGVLEHCLEKRYRVDFGLPVWGTRQKKVAIPFSAADVPSERSEFSHPDVCIVLTLLGYYHGGLTKEEVRNAFKMLLRLDISEQEHQYDRWFVSVEPGLTDTDRMALCNVRHISLADSRQFETLCRVYKYCMEAINFFLNTCVFPNDTQQYPQRLSRTAWNLAAGDCTIGFSGTNDNHRLLPLPVAQREPNEPSLLGTNGKMIDKIIRVTHSYEVINASPRRGLIPWQSVLLFAIDKKAQALIDTGALLAGVVNNDAAKFLLEQPDFAFAGVTFYDSRKEHNCWMIAEKTRQIVMPLEQAPMHEKETFVIFDEARSRGSDRKLSHNASALITLGPKLAKDKLMQGAGRMRQLGCNQTLWIASFDEVAQSILQSSAHREIPMLTAVDVLNWVMDNTRDECIRGLLEWSKSGLQYQKTRLDPKSELVDEDWSLEFLYQEKLVTDKIARIVESQAHRVFGDFDNAFVAQICRRSRTYGLDDEVCCISHTGECEREIRVTQEKNQVDDNEVAERTPSEETTWNYRKVLQARSVEELHREVEVMTLEGYTRKWISPANFADFSWANTRVFGTKNFFTTIMARNAMDRMNEFLRVIDVVLMFDNGQVLLVSECEADHILALLWSSSVKSSNFPFSSIGKELPECSFRFVNFAFACESVNGVEAPSKFRNVHMVLGTKSDHRDQDLPLSPIVACYLYNGETMLTNHQEIVMEPILRDLLRPGVQRETTLSNFVKSRGNGHKWMRSFLHQLCCLIDLEECNR